VAIDVQRGAQALPPATAACMGAFDGLHRGHQALIQHARTLGDRVALVTFEPHPARVLAPNRAPRLLQTPAQRERVAAAFGVDVLVLLQFDEAMSRLSPDAFVRDYIIEGLRPEALVVGADFRFGAGRAGDTQQLGRLIAPARIELAVVDPVLDENGGKLGSTEVRAAIEAGDMGRAAEILGRWHAVHGPVIQGAKRGRALGYPTANIDVGDGYVPPIGIYATVLAVWDPQSPDYGALWPSVTSVGRNPTFARPSGAEGARPSGAEGARPSADLEAAPVTVEAYVLDRDLGERLYGVEVELSFVARLRDEETFDSVGDLVTQIDRDCEQARPLLGPQAIARTLAPPPSAEPAQ
jgi:riboflavin kinase/FMN adenylyltransferase